MASIKLSEATIRAGASEKVFARGQELLRRGAVSRTTICGSTLSGECEGNDSPFYKARVELDEGGVRSASCTCPYDFGGYCKHLVALLLAYALEPERFAVRQDPAELLSGLNREQLLALLTRLLRELPDLSDRVEAALAAPSVAGQRQAPAAKRKKGVDAEVYRRRVRSVMRGLDCMSDSEAIRVGERGLQLGGRKAALGQWLGPLEEAQGRKKQALEAWLAAFREAPSLALWQTIKRLAGSRWSRLKPQAMSSLEKFYDKQPLAEVLLEERDWDAAMRVADKHAQDERVAAKVADALIEHRPEWVIRTSIKHAESLIAPTKSNLYPAAADWLRRAKAAYARVGRDEEWQRYLLRLKEQYRRRPALMAQLSGL